MPEAAKTSLNVRTAVIATALAGVAVGGAAIVWPSSTPPASAAGLQGLLRIDASVARHQLAELEAEAPPEQEAAFADGDISLDEYEGAVEGTVSCFEAGFSELRAQYGYAEGDVRLAPEEPDTSDDEFAVTYSYTIDGPAVSEATQEQQDAVVALEERCQAEEQGAIEEAYQVEQLADPGYVEEVAETFAECVNDEAGLAVDGDDEREVVQTITEGIQGEARTPVTECLDDTPAVSSGLADG